MVTLWAIERLFKDGEIDTERSFKAMMDCEGGAIIGWQISCRPQFRAWRRPLLLVSR
jgi:hypothetical protein